MQNVSREKLESNTSYAASSLNRCFVGGNTIDSAGGRTRRKAFGVSVVIESALLATLILSPILTGIATPKLFRPTPPVMVNLVGWHAERDTSNTNTGVKPIRRNAIVPRWDFRPRLPNPVTNPNTAAESENNLPAVEPDGFFGAPLETASLGMAPPSIPAAPNIRQNTQERRAVKKNEGIQQALLTARIEPQYPYLARVTRTEGTVILHAMISMDGRITSLEVLSGPALLVQAAVDAVRQWRYRPTLLSGEPVEVETTVTVTFRLEK